MQYTALSKANGTKAYEDLANFMDPAWDALEESRGAGQPMQIDHLLGEVEQLCDLYRSQSADVEGPLFEGWIGTVLHQHIADPVATLDPDFWRWLALRPLRDLVLLRHQVDRNEMPSKANFGLGSVYEGLPYRAWARAAIGYDEEAPIKDRYALALRGDQDFWRSHILRQTYAYSRPLAQSLIRFQYPTDAGGPTLKPGTHPLGIRELAKRLKRFQANCALPLLSEDQCSHLLDFLSDGLVKADGESYRSTGMI